MRPTVTLVAATGTADHGTVEARVPVAADHSRLVAVVDAIVEHPEVAAVRITAAPATGGGDAAVLITAARRHPRLADDLDELADLVRTAVATAPRQDNPRQDDPRQDEPRQDEPRQDEPRRDDLPAAPEPSAAGAIARTVYQFTVLHPADQPPVDLADALGASYDGNAVGAVTDERTEALADAAVPDELRRLGNDGTFFDFELGADPDADPLADAGD